MRLWELESLVNPTQLWELESVMESMTPWERMEISKRMMAKSNPAERPGRERLQLQGSYGAVFAFVVALASGPFWCCVHTT
jgi:hypothetical protein